MANRRATSSHERSDLIDDGGEFVRYRAYRFEEHVSVKATAPSAISVANDAAPDDKPNQ
jgi:hypothetical protein